MKIKDKAPWVVLAAVVEALKVVLIQTELKVPRLIKVNPEITPILLVEKIVEIPKCKQSSSLKVNS
jgi:hypothetical protein